MVEGYLEYLETGLSSISGLVSYLAAHFHQISPYLEKCRYERGPFVPVPKKWLLAYQPEERKSRSLLDIVGKLYELDRLEFSFPPAGVFQTPKRG